MRASLSQQELAAIIGVDRATVSTWENESRVPSLQSGWRCARALGLTVEMLILGTKLELPESMPRRPKHYATTGARERAQRKPKPAPVKRAAKSKAQPRKRRHATLEKRRWTKRVARDRGTRANRNARISRPSAARRKTARTS